MEWATTMPPAPYNFISLPRVQTRHPLWDDPQLPSSMAAGELGLAHTDPIYRETWGTDAITGKVREVFHLPTNSWLPLQGGGLLAMLCISLLVRAYPLAVVAAVATVLVLLRWSWHNGAHPHAAPVLENESADPPLHSRTLDGAGLWGMVVTLMANGTLYASLLFGWFYLWTVAPRWSVPQEASLGFWSLLGCGLLLTAGAVYYRAFVRRLRTDNDQHLQCGLWVTAIIGLLHWVWLLWLLVAADLSPRELAHDAVLMVMMIYLLIHSGMVTVATAMQAMRVKIGYVSRALPYEPMVLQPLWSYTLGVFWLSFAAFILLPMTWATGTGV